MGNRLSLIKNIVLSNFIRPTSPYKITFALTYRCGMRCKTCRIWSKPYRAELSIGEIEKTFKAMNNLSWLDLTGGEISLREDLTEAIRAVIKNSDKLSVLHISTNGQWPDRIFALAKEIQKASLALIINISIWAPPQKDIELRGVNGSYSKSLETFRLLKSLPGVYCYLSCTLSDYNIDYVDDLISGLRTDLASFTLSDLHFNIFYNSPHYFKNDQIQGTATLSLKDLKRYLVLCRNGNVIKRFLEDKYLKVLDRTLRGGKFFLNCQALKSSCFINPYGEVYPCTADDRIIGNLKDYDYCLGKMWNTSLTLKERNEIEYRKCKRCLGTCEVYHAMFGDMLRTLFA